MKTLKNWIIIAGNGRNTGKTTLACRIIARAGDAGIVGIKISPHRHLLAPGEDVLFSNGDYDIVRERFLTSKDSSRMLKAGAAEVFYVQCPDEALDEALGKLEELTAGRPVVCESGGLGRLVSPAFFIMVVDGGREVKPGVDENVRRADIVTGLDEAREYPSAFAFEFRDRTWLKTMAYDTI